jgi:hypothetical protein
MRNLHCLVRRTLRAHNAVLGARRSLDRGVAVQFDHRLVRPGELAAVDLDLEITLRPCRRCREPDQQHDCLAERSREAHHSHKEVCDGLEAQASIATDWLKHYRDHVLK